MDVRTALADARGFGAASRILIGRHARERMAERGVLHEDVRNALATVATDTATSSFSSSSSKQV